MNLDVQEVSDSPSLQHVDADDNRRCAGEARYVGEWDGESEDEDIDCLLEQLHANACPGILSSLPPLLLSLSLVLSFLSLSLTLSHTHTHTHLMYRFKETGAWGIICLQTWLNDMSHLANAA